MILFPTPPLPQIDIVKNFLIEEDIFYVVFLYSKFIGQIKFFKMGSTIEALGGVYVVNIYYLKKGFICINMYNLSCISKILLFFKI
jgi:hypothetical protein